MTLPSGGKMDGNNYEEHSAFPASEFNPSHEVDREQQEEYEAEQEEIEEGVIITN